MTELSVLKLLLTKDIYNKYNIYISKLELDQEYKILVKLIGDYYSEFDHHDYIAIDELKTYFRLHYPTIKNQELYNEIFSKMTELQVSDSLATKYVQTLVEKHYASQMIAPLIGALEGREIGIMPKIRNLVDQCEEALDISDGDDNEFVTDDLTELLRETIDNPGFDWRLEFLQTNAGPVRGGQMIHVFARTDFGKTSFLHSEISHFATQLQPGDMGLWFNNEGRADLLKLRWYSAVLGRSLESIIANQEAADRFYRQYGGNRVKFISKGIITVYDIERYMKIYKPKFVIADIADKVKVRAHKDARGDEVLGQLYNRFRELAIAYDSVFITAAQASAEAKGKKYLTEDMMANSKTAKPSELDLAIGIGGSDKDDVRRYLSLPKNKLLSNPEATKGVAKFNRAIARFEDL
jgi:replicative DNA helicase